MSGHETPNAMSPARRYAALDRSPSPRPLIQQRSGTPSRLPSFSTQSWDSWADGSGSTAGAGPSAGPRRVSATQTVIGFGPPPTQTANGIAFPPAGPSPRTSMMGMPMTSSPVTTQFALPKPSASGRPSFSQQYQSSDHFDLPSSPPRGAHRPEVPGSPRALPSEIRSRRNSGAVVSISLSSRSRSRTPRGRSNLLPARSGSGTPNNTNNNGPTSNGANGGGDAAAAWAPGVDDMDDMDDWQPTGGVLLDADEEEERHDNFGFDDFQSQGRSWTAETDASHIADVLRPGMVFGEGLEFEGDVIAPAVGRLQVNSTSDVGLPLRRDFSAMGTKRNPNEKKTYDVIRQLGSGSYACVYLVRERGGRKREYALKCLSKHDLEEDQLETQLFEATIHLSLPIHRNIVTLHDTLQTKNWLFLMLELCPGEDLFYWLERSRDASPPPANATLPGDHDDPRGRDIMSSSRLSSSSIPFSSSQLFSNFPGSFTNSPGAFSPNNGFNGFTSGSQYSASPASLLFAHHNGSQSISLSSHAATPPTPSLLSAFSANTLLTPRRLRLIASMFSQMCEAVAVCHDAGVSHRDIKPENFICCDSVELEAENTADGSPDFGPQARRKVIVKLTDFGLATTEEESGDVECGSKPYMSYECRNNLGPSYRPKPADVWSLGIVLINMLFHRNPWKDPTDGDANFDAFLADRAGFFQTKFTGIGKEVATYLAERVLCIDVDARVSAREFGQWVRQLPEMIAGRRAVQALKVARLENRAKNGSDKGMFAKAPVAKANHRQSGLANALNANAVSPLPVPTAELPPPPPTVPAQQVQPQPQQQSQSSSQAQPPSLSSLPPKSELSDGGASQVAPTPDLLLEGDEIRSATTVDDNPTPSDLSTVVSPEPPEDADGLGDHLVKRSETQGTSPPEGDERSLSTQKRRKRGIRKGKAAQAALAAQQAGSDGTSREERDAFLAELVAASEQLARDLSKKKTLDVTHEAEFPPLGATPQQIAAARKSRWKDFLAMSKGNPQLEALAQRVAEREAAAGSTWSAPAQLQHQGTKSPPREAPRHTATTNGTMSLGGADEDDDWRKRDKSATPKPADGGAKKSSRRATDDSSRSRQAALAAAAIAGGMEMGSFGRPSHLGRPVPLNNNRRSPLGDEEKKQTVSMSAFAPPSKSSFSPTTSKSSHKESFAPKSKDPFSPTASKLSTKSHTTSTTSTKVPSPAATASKAPKTSPPLTSPPITAPKTSPPITTTAPSAPAKGVPLSKVPSPGEKPKMKQMSSLVKMFGGLKTKGKE